jgi:hypothetical protein
MVRPDIKGSSKLYAENPEIAKEHRKNGVKLFQDDDLRYLNYIYPILSNFSWLKWLGPLLLYLPVVGLS